jgi:hypothetical protein
LKTAGLALDTVDFQHLPASAETWEKVIRKVHVGMMPPQGVPRPDSAHRAAFLSELEGALDSAAQARPNPGRALVHRLNRSEYANAIRDLLALDVDPAALLPSDDSAYGFDNVADVLGVSSTLLERYLSAAGKVSSLAVGDTEITPGSETFRVRQDASQDVHIEGLPIGTVGGVLANITLPLDGEYALSSKMFRTNLGAMRGLEYEHQLEYAVDGARVHVAKVGGEDDFEASLATVTQAADAIDARTRVRIRLTAGPHAISVAFLQRSHALNPFRLQPFIRSSNDTLDTTGEPHVDLFTITGPFNATGPGDTPSRRRIFVCRPALPAEEDVCARKVIATLSRRAYRGQDTASDRERLFAFYQRGRREGNFDRGIQMALRRILASPKFVLRVENDPANVPPDSVYRISDFELASRLSFFLWSSIPDDELLQVAEKGRLRNPAVLAQQARRMLADPKSQAFVTNFAGQWLYLRNLRTQQPNSNEFPDFDDNLRQAFEREASMFFESIVREDRSVLDLMTADYTFVNERLAKHYGMPNIYGSQFRRVPVTDEAHKGLLGKGAILLVTSHADRTSPVVRGKWVLDNILNSPPPPPPPNVPALNESAQRGGRVLTMRERMEEHRADPACASCHRLMDPIGFSMENFDAIGAWRTRDGGTLGSPINASGQLPDGAKIDGVVTLRQALLQQPDIFVQTLTEKLMTFALGRGVVSYDMPTVRAIVRDAEGQNYRFLALVMGIVNSGAFQMRLSAPHLGEVPLRAAAH